MTRNRRMIIKSASLIGVNLLLCFGAIFGMQEVLAAIRNISSIEVQYQFIRINLIYIGLPVAIIAAQILHTVLIRVWETFLAFLDPVQIDMMIPALEEERDFKLAKEGLAQEKELERAKGYIAKRVAGVQSKIKRIQGNGKQAARAK